MSKLTQLIATQCCGALMGHDVKLQIIAELEVLETAYEVAKKDLVEAAITLAEAEKKNLARLEELFYSLYKGDNAHQAWLQLCAELSYES